MEIKRLKKMLEPGYRSLIPVTFRLLIGEVIELKERMEEAEKVIRNLSIEVNEHINK